MVLFCHLLIAIPSLQKCISVLSVTQQVTNIPIPPGCVDVLSVYVQMAGMVPVACQCCQSDALLEKGKWQHTLSPWALGLIAFQHSPWGAHILYTHTGMALKRWSVCL